MIAVRHLPALIVLALTVTPVGADALKDCAAIADGAKRLACYDHLAGRVEAPASDAQRFGAATLPPSVAEKQAEEPKEIRARLATAVDGWKRGTPFALDNGQVWISIDEREQYAAFGKDVAVTIRRNFVGSYFLGIDGKNASVRVRRAQ